MIDKLSISQIDDREKIEYAQFRKITEGGAAALDRVQRRSRLCLRGSRINNITKQEGGERQNTL